jgi:hypothetical protein
MALGKSVNSYVTVAEADAYFEDRLDAAAWVEASSDEKAKALITATSYLDGLDWLGTAVSSEQALAFPRNGAFYEPRLGAEVTLTAVVPDRIIKATYELAYHFLNNDGLLDDTGSVINLQIASINLAKIKNASKIPHMVKRLIDPLRITGVSNTWWRAN